MAPKAASKSTFRLSRRRTIESTRMRIADIPHHGTEVEIWFRTATQQMRLDQSLDESLPNYRAHG